MDLLSSAACNVHIFPEVVQPVFKRVDGRRVHDMLREFIPCVDHSLRLYFSGFKFLVAILYQKLLKLVDFHSVTQKIKMDAIMGHF